MKYIFELRSVYDTLLVEDLFDVIIRMQSPPLSFKKYGTTEPCKKDFDMKNIDDIKSDFNQGIIIKGGGQGNKTYLMYSTHTDSGIVFWNFVFDLKGKLSEMHFNGIVELLKVLNERTPVIYGILCSQVEYDHLHKEVVYFETGGTKEGWRGVADADFLKFLPGIYWFNFFGKELAQALGIEKIKSVPNVKYIDFENGGVAFYLNEPIDSIDMNERSTRLFRISEHIGLQYFFNIVNKDETEFNHPPAFRKYLDKIADNFKKN